MFVAAAQREWGGFHSGPVVFTVAGAVTVRPFNLPQELL